MWRESTPDWLALCVGGGAVVVAVVVVVVVVVLQCLSGGALVVVWGFFHFLCCLCFTISFFLFAPLYVRALWAFG